MLAALAVVVALRVAGGVAWLPGVLVVSLIVFATAIAQIARASRIVADAMETVATESGMLPLAADAKAWRPIPDEIPREVEPDVLNGRSTASAPAGLKVVPLDLTTAARADTRGAPVSAKQARER